MKITGFKDTIAWYDKNAEEYTSKAEKRVTPDQIDEFLTYIPNKAKILDAGCGFGRETKIFHSKGYDVTGIDISVGLLRLAKRKNPDVPFIFGDFRNLHFPSNSFDAVWVHASLLHLETINDVEKAIKEFYRVLIVGGIIHILVHAQRGKEKTKVILDSLTGNRRFFQYFKKKELKELMQKMGFKIIKISRFNEAETYPQIEGARKNVDWILVLARKI